MSAPPRLPVPMVLSPLFWLDTRSARMCCYIAGKEEKAAWRRLAGMAREDPDNPNQQGGPSWILMLLLILLAMLAATGVAWAFIHPMLHPK